MSDKDRDGSRNEQFMRTLAQELSDMPVAGRLDNTDEAEALAVVVRRVMESAAGISVPLVVETGVGPTWAAAH